MTFPAIIKILKSNHFYPRIEETVKKNKNVITGLIVDCPQLILMEPRVKRLQEILAENNVTGYKVYGLKNKGEIYIERDDTTI